MTLFLTRKTSASDKISIVTPFLLSSYFHTHRITLLLQILGGRMHGPSLTSSFLGNVPQFTLSLRPWVLCCLVTSSKPHKILIFACPQYLAETGGIRGIHSP